MWLWMLWAGCRTVPEKPYRIDEATGNFSSWKSNFCICKWFAGELQAQLSCSDVGLGEVTLYLPFAGRDANSRIAGTAVAQIDMGGLNSSAFSGGPVIWEYGPSYLDPRAKESSAAYVNIYRRDVIIHELAVPGVEACPALESPGGCLDFPESRLKMALVCDDFDRSLPARVSRPFPEPLVGDPVVLRGGR